MMGNLNPINNEFVQELKDIERDIESLERARQPYLGDWINLNVGDATLDGSNDRITFSNIEVEDYFNVGTRIRLSRTSATPSSYDYLVVIEVDTTNNRIEMSGDSISGSTLLYLDFSNVASPVGFPTSFSYSPTLSGNGFTISDSGTVTANYYVIGSICYIEVKRTGQEWTNPTNTDSAVLEEDLPITRNNNYQVGIANRFSGTIESPASGGGNTFFTSADISIISTTDVEIAPDKPSSASWGDTAADNIQWNYRAAYLIA
jgi:hypothetical protein